MQPTATRGQLRFPGQTATVCTYFRRLKKPSAKRHKLKGLTAGTPSFLPCFFLSFSFSQPSRSKVMLTVCR